MVKKKKIMKKTGKSFFRNPPKETDFHLATPTESDAESSNLFDIEEEDEEIDQRFEFGDVNGKNKKVGVRFPTKSKPLTDNEKIIWYLWFISLLLIGILGVMIGTLVGTFTTGAVVAQSEQFSRAVALIDRVYGLYDYTKSMAEMSLESKENVVSAMKEYEVSKIMNSVHNMATKGSAFVDNLDAKTVEDLKQTGMKLSESLQQMDMEEAKKLMSHANQWASAIPREKVTQSIEEATALLQKGNDVLKKAQDSNLVQHISEFAAGGVELEARAQRLNEITIKLPQ